MLLLLLLSSLSLLLPLMVIIVQVRPPRGGLNSFDFVIKFDLDLGGCEVNMMGLSRVIVCE